MEYESAPLCGWCLDTRTWFTDLGRLSIISPAVTRKVLFNKVFCFNNSHNLVHSPICFRTALERLRRSWHFFPVEWTFDGLRAFDGSQKGQEIQHFEILRLQIRQACEEKSHFSCLNFWFVNRITVPYAVVIWYVSTLHVFLGNGPMWFFAITLTVKNCQEYWWASFLYVSNYFFSGVSLIFF